MLSWTYTWLARPALVNINPDELSYYSYMVDLGSFGGSNSTDDVSDRSSIPNKLKYINLKGFGILKTINESQLH